MSNNELMLLMKNHSLIIWIVIYFYINTNQLFTITNCIVVAENILNLSISYDLLML